MSAAETVTVAQVFSDLYERYNALTLRERILLTLAVLAVTWMVWSATVGGFLERSKGDIERDMDQLYAQLQAEVAEQSRLRAARLNDPNVRLHRERTILDAELKSLNVTLSSVLDRFVAPERMPLLLEDVIQKHSGLKLKRMVSLPVEAVILGESEEDSGEQTPPAPRVYKHTLRLEFEGDYFDVVAYLIELEASDWEFGWRRLDYAVTEHPLAEVTIEIETLSREKSWIGV